MRYTIPLLLGCILFFQVSAQDIPGQHKADSLQDKRMADSVNKEALYIYRKYSFSLAVAPYTNITHGGGNYVFGTTEVTFCDRFNWLNATKNASVEAIMGAAFAPFQGTKLNLGLDLLLLPNKSHRTNLYGGVVFSQGFTQSTNYQGSSYVNVGNHSYLMPFLGFVWWPWKANYVYHKHSYALTSKEQDVNQDFEHPHIPQLFFLKVQIGYSFLLNNRIDVDTSGGFPDAHLYQVIRNNTASTLVFRISVGINIPSVHDREMLRRAQFNESLKSL